MSSHIITVRVSRILTYPVTVSVGIDGDASGEFVSANHVLGIEDRDKLIEQAFAAVNRHDDEITEACERIDVASLRGDDPDYLRKRDQELEV